MIVSIRRTGRRRSIIGRFCATALASVLLISGNLMVDVGIATSGGGRTAIMPETNSYRLGAQDVIRIRVFEWRASRDEIFSWAALNTEYTIGPAGEVSIPLLGQLPAAGATTGDLARVLADRLRDKLGLAQPPDTTVEIVTYRPIYTVGVLERPGEYAYRPGLTVLMAISLSGGIQKIQDAALLRLEREVISSGGDLQALLQEKDAGEIRKLRLEAEASDLPLRFPASLLGRRNEEHIARLLEQETAIFSSRRRSLDTQLDALKSLTKFLESEVQSLKGQLEIHDRRMALVKIELDSVTSLSNKGLTTAPRRLALERNYAEMQADRLRLETAVSRALQEISRTAISMLELTNKRSTETAAEIVAIQSRIHQIAVRIGTVTRLGAETKAYGQLRHQLTSRPNALRYSIIRISNGQPVVLAAKETTQLLPGDTLRVEPAVESDDAPLAPGPALPSPHAPSADDMPVSDPTLKRLGYMLRPGNLPKLPLP